MKPWEWKMGVKVIEAFERKWMVGGKVGELKKLSMNCSYQIVKFNETGLTA